MAKETTVSERAQPKIEPFGTLMHTQAVGREPTLNEFIKAGGTAHIVEKMMPEITRKLEHGTYEREDLLNLLALEYMASPPEARTFGAIPMPDGMKVTTFGDRVSLEVATKESQSCSEKDVAKAKAILLGNAPEGAEAVFKEMQRGRHWQSVGMMNSKIGASDAVKDFTDQLDAERVRLNDVLLAGTGNKEDRARIIAIEELTGFSVTAHSGMSIEKLNYNFTLDEIENRALFLAATRF